MDFPDMSLDMLESEHWNSSNNFEPLELDSTVGIDNDIYLSQSLCSESMSKCDRFDDETIDSHSSKSDTNCVESSNYFDFNELSPSMPTPKIGSKLKDDLEATPKPAIIVVADSSVSSSKPGKRGPPGGDPNSKNAIAARDNRLKKKKYIASLENTVKELKCENNELHNEAKICRESVVSLQREVQYLRGIIANQTTLAAVLKSVAQTPGIKLSSSLKKPSFGVLKNVEEKCASGVTDVSCMQSDSKARKATGFQPGRGMRRGQVTSKKKIQKRSKAHPSSELLNREKQINVEDSDSDCSISERENSVMEAKTQTPSGICLHVSGDVVSLELCAHCSSNALADHSYFVKSDD